MTIDAQHGMFGKDMILGLLQAVSAGPAVPLVRPSSMSIPEIGWLLDAGAFGVIAPSIDTPQLARDLVDACFYPPSGRRSYGPTRGLLYGGADYVATARETIMPWAMIESRSALRHLEQIMATPGLYGVYLGPNDLAMELGVDAGGALGEEVSEIAHHLVDRAHHYGLAAGLFCSSATEAKRWADAGFDLVTPGKDVGMLQSVAAQSLATIKGIVPSINASPGY